MAKDKFDTLYQRYFFMDRVCKSMPRSKSRRRLSTKVKSCQRAVVRKEMHLWKRGKLTIGKSRFKVKNPRQAIAIALSVARSKCGGPRYIPAKSNKKRSKQSRRHRRKRSSKH